jgi:signal transduction histidine kinase
VTVSVGAAQRLRLASIATGALVVGAVTVRVANPMAVPGPSVSAIIPLLWGIGALIVVVLTQSWAPTLAWAAAIVGSSAAALAIVGVGVDARTARADVGQAPELWLELLVVVVLLLPPTIAAAYATIDARRPRLVAVLAWTAIAVLAIGMLGRVAGRSLRGELGGTIPEWLWLAIIGLLTAVGLARDLRPAFARTRERVAAGERGGRRTGGAWSLLRVFVDELVPGREVGRAEAVETERGRLAADLHAEVLPSLRRALAEAETGGTVERLALDLRSAVDEVEAMLVARRSIVLEEMGLLAAIEWLAERVEDRSDVRVEIEVDGGNVADGDPTSRPPRDAERAAFRVAQLALDNVVRHAPSSTAVATIAVAPDRIRLRIEDDGPGRAIDEAAAARAGRRGIADMRAEARSCGASLEVGAGAGERGTAVAFAWPG